MSIEEVVDEIRGGYDNVVEQAAVEMLYNAYRLTWRSTDEALLLARSDFERIKIRSRGDGGSDDR